MYNRYPRGTEPWYAMQDAISACKSVEEGHDEAVDVFERVIDELDTAISEKEEAEDELERLQEEHETTKAALEQLHAIKPEMITLLTNMKLAGEAMGRYATIKLQELGALNESSADSGDGDSGDGGDEGATVPVDGQETP